MSHDTHAAVPAATVVASDGNNGTEEGLAYPGVAPGAAMADPGQLVRATGAIDPVHQYLSSQWVLHTPIQWSASQPTGTVLFNLPLNPQNGHNIMRYYAAMFNTWTGGFEFRLQSVGTGFNGGKAVLCVIPPNREWNEYSITDYTMFPYVEIDVKESGVVDICTKDWNLALAHPTNIPPNDDLGAFAHMTASSGTLVLFVEANLFSYSSQGTEVTLLLKQRLAPDFAFGQFIPVPSLGVPSYNIDLSILNFASIPQFDPYWPIIPLKKLIVSTATVSLYAGVDNLIKWNGDTFVDRDHELNRKYPLAQLGEGTGTTADSWVGELPNQPRTRVKYSNTTVFQWFLSDTAANKTSSVSELDFSKDNLVLCHTANDMTGVNLATLSFGNQALDVGYAEPIGKDGPSVVNPLGEALVYFGSKDNELGQLTTWHIHQHLLSGGMRNAPTNQTALFELVDILTEQPLRYIRWWPDGYFTSRLGQTVSNYNLDSVYMRFVSLLPDTAGTPMSNGLVMSNDSLYRQRYEHQILVAKTQQHLGLNIPELEPVPRAPPSRKQRRFYPPLDLKNSKTLAKKNPFA